jgi:hypothetical protein
VDDLAVFQVKDLVGQVDEGRIVGGNQWPPDSSPGRCLA